jgi:methionine sulfoxide reductase catalytic subunit
MGPKPSEITPQAVWDGRRGFLQAALALTGGLAVAPVRAQGEAPNTLDEISRYNNYAEFSSNKDVVWKLAEDFRPLPWTVSVEGECEKPRTWALDDLLQRHAQQDRIYRLRCVEGWSFVVPWRGFPLAALLAESRPTSRARYVAFEAVMRPQEMVGQRRPSLNWPYVEALRIDEAMHPLTLLVSGAYGQALPSANGAPLRLAVPWKYGFKSIKAITRIRFVEQPPATAWMRAAPSEYGFYANVNPEVSHPRWSQRREVRLGETVKRPTLPFNGYGAEVAPLYAGMDLRQHF